MQPQSGIRQAITQVNYRRPTLKFCLQTMRRAKKRCKHASMRAQMELIPPPRKHQITYGGVFSAHSKLRPQIIPSAPEATPQAEADSVTPCRKHAKRLEWARLIARVFEIDVLTCPRCHSKGMQAIASIMDGDVIDKILRSVGMPTDSPEFAPPALPQQAAFDFA